MAKPHQSDAFGAPLTKSVTVTLPLTVLADLDRVARRMKVTRSALLSEMLGPSVAAMAEVVDALPEVGATSTDVRRARGKSVALIEAAVGEAQALTRQLRRARPRAKPK